MVYGVQNRIVGWPSRKGDYPAESIVDRSQSNAYVIEFKGEVSMSERCMDEELRVYANYRRTRCALRKICSRHLWTPVPPGLADLIVDADIV